MPVSTLDPPRALFDDLALTPENIEVLADALLLACIKLKVPERRAYERDIIAARIIDLARTGIVDAAALSDRIVREANLGAD